MLKRFFAKKNMSIACFLLGIFFFFGWCLGSLGIVKQENDLLIWSVGIIVTGIINERYG